MVCAGCKITEIGFFYVKPIKNLKGAHLPIGNLIMELHVIWTWGTIKNY